MFSDNTAEIMTLGPPSGREDGDYNGLGCAEISSIFVKQDAILFETEPLENPHFNPKLHTISLSTSGGRELSIPKFSAAEPHPNYTSCMT